MFVLSPALIGQGTALEIISAGATAMIGVWIASCGLIGFMFGRLGVAERLLTFAAGILLLLPAHAIAYGVLAQRDRARASGALIVGKDYLARRRATLKATR